MKRPRQKAPRRAEARRASSPRGERGARGRPLRDGRRSSPEPLRGELELRPGSWLPRGEALAESPELPAPVAVWQGIPGERCRARVTHRGQHRWTARWIEPLDQPHPWRVEPPCERYALCGGCPLMHLSPEGQRAAREELVARAFEEEGLPPPPLEPWVEGPDGSSGYRHAARFAAGYSDHGHPRIGALGRYTRTIVPIPRCPAIPESLRRAVALLSRHARGLGVDPYRPESGEGLLRYALYRRSRASGELLLLLVAGRPSPRLGELARALAEAQPELAGVFLHLNRTAGNAFFELRGEPWSPEGASLPTTRLFGRDRMRESAAGVSFWLGPGSFYQTNPGVADRLYREALRWVLPDRPFIELYAGVGALALAASRRSGLAVGVEGLREAVALARESASSAGLPAEFVAGGVLHQLPRLARRFKGTGPVVAVDPARRGLEEGVVEALAELAPSRLLYLSCNPRSLARDLRALRGIGLEPVRFVPFDMFPNTPHLELLALLETRGGPRAPSRRSPRRHLVRPGEDSG